jgi:tRNA threonylcarbamoyladenosine biosynthesis protein TsaE
MAVELSLETRGDEATSAFGVLLGQAIQGPLVIALYGEMGSGKTTLVRGLAEGLGVCGVVNSPTYTLMQRYEGRYTLDHYDAWMEGREREVLADGAYELLGQGGVSVIEWADRVEDWLPSELLEVHIRVSGALERGILLRWRSRGSSLPPNLKSLGDWFVPDDRDEGIS